MYIHELRMCRRTSDRTLLGELFSATLTANVKQQWLTDRHSTVLCWVHGRADRLRNATPKNCVTMRTSLHAPLLGTCRCACTSLLLKFRFGFFDGSALIAPRSVSRFASSVLSLAGFSSLCFSSPVFSSLFFSSPVFRSSSNCRRNSSRYRGSTPAKLAALATRISSAKRRSSEA